MPRYAALLRGINVGRAKRMKMEDLRTACEDAGFTDVATLLQSGNLVFSAKEKKPAVVVQQLETAIVKRFGFSSSVVLRSRDELARALDTNPFKQGLAEPSKLLVFFLSDVPDAKLVRAIDAKQYAPDELSHVGKEIYAWFPNGIRDSKLALLLMSTKLGVVVTSRNIATVTKLLALADAA